MFLEFSTSNRLVVLISDVEPIAKEGYSFVKSDAFVQGDEFEFSIYVGDVDMDNVMTSHSAIRNNPNAVQLLKDNSLLKLESSVLGQQLVEKDLQILDLQATNEELGKQIVDLDLRLLGGGL